MPPDKVARRRVGRTLGELEQWPPGWVVIVVGLMTFIACVTVTVLIVVRLRGTVTPAQFDRYQTRTECLIADLEKRQALVANGLRTLPPPAKCG